MSFGLGLSLPIRQILGGGGFSPASLFAAGEEGVWYDPSDFTTLYADTAGTTAITAVEQPVGLMLDKSQGLVLGPELVTNGTFDTDTTGWTTQGAATATWDSGFVLIDMVNIGTWYSENFRLSSPILTVGKWYSLSFDAKNVSGTASLRVANNAAVISDITNLPSSFTRYTATFQCTVANTFSFFKNGLTGGFALDNISVKELPGNHAVAANNSTARPVLRNRYNLLTYSEQFDNAAWTKTNATVTPNATVAPDGTNSADALIEASDTSQLHSTNASTIPLTGAYSFSIYAKANGRNWLVLNFAVVSGAFSSSDARAWFDLNTGTLGTVAGTGASATISSEGNGWYRCTISTNYPVLANRRVMAATATADGSTSNNGDGTSGIYIWGAQLTTAADHDAINGEYQRIAAAPTVGAAPTYDSDVTKFPPYLFATTDDAMSTASIDFSSGDEMSVFAGVTKESDAASGFLAEFSNVTASNNGVFALLAPSSSGTNSYRYVSKGTAEVSAGTGVFAAAPDTAIITGLSDISADITTLRRNGSLVETSTSDQGTGNFGNYPLYLFARNTSQFFYTGRLYSLIVRNKLPTADELSGAETYVNTKTRAY